jgi:Domain of unknown function (DUF4476)
MKYLTIVFFTLFLFLLPGLKAQQNHFIYIQTENHQTFYVKLEKKIFTSSASGYLILPKLKAGEYQLSIGFQKNGVVEQNMICTIDKTDIGFILKNFGAKGWGLFNLQTLDVIMNNTAGNSSTVSVVSKTDAFSNMLSEIVNDSSIRQIETYSAETKKLAVKEKKPTDLVIVQQVPASQIKTVEAIVQAPAVNLKSSPAKDSVNVQQPVLNYAKSTINRSLIKKEEGGTTMIFIDEKNGSKDTISVFIPIDKLPVPVVEEKPVVVAAPLPEVQPVVAVRKDNVGNSRFLDIELPVNTGLSTEKKPVENEAVKNNELSREIVKKEPENLPLQVVIHQTPMVNSDCKILASEEDCLKLRKKMATASSEEEMLKLAKKSLKSKCYLVEQIKNLSAVFLKDAGRFAFFEAAYPFAFDSHNFGNLQNQLVETNYINRFQLMIHH